jgi:hypothetical protein
MQPRASTVVAAVILAAALQTASSQELTQSPPSKAWLADYGNQSCWLYEPYLAIVTAADVGSRACGPNGWATLPDTLSTGVSYAPCGSAVQSPIDLARLPGSASDHTLRPVKRESHYNNPSQRLKLDLRAIFAFAPGRSDLLLVPATPSSAQLGAMIQPLTGEPVYLVAATPKTPSEHALNGALSSLEWQEYFTSSLAAAKNSAQCFMAARIAASGSRVTRTEDCLSLAFSAVTGWRHY